MNSLLYVLKMENKNRLLKNLRRPGFYLLLLFIAFYIYQMVTVANTWVKQSGNNTPEFFVMGLTVLLLYLNPANYSAFAKRKGIQFQPSHVHLMFSSPISPKLMLMFSHLKMMGISFLLEIAVIAAGVFLFRIPAFHILLYFLCISCFNSIVEFALVICLYGNERIPERMMALIAKIFWVVLFILIAVPGAYLLKNGFSFANILYCLNSDWVCYFPVFGWLIACIRLVILGPSTAAVIGSFCYFIYGAVLILAAWKMKCTGEYYEDAMKFADDYQKLVEKKKKGDVSTNIGKRLRRDISVTYKGSGAKAIFYRQLLEYRKSKFFFFSVTTLLYLGIGVGYAILYSTGRIRVSGVGKYYAILGIMAYLVLIFGQMQTKWEKELENPYIYLIPAGPFSKLLYATILDHMKTACEVLLLALPYCFVMKVPWYYMLLIVVTGVIAKAVKLYSDTICRLLMANHFGDTVRQILRMLIAWTLIGIAVPIGVVCHIFGGPFLALGAADIYLLVAAIMLMIASSGAFARMEFQAG